MTQSSLKTALAALAGEQHASTVQVLPVRVVDDRDGVRVMVGVDAAGASCVLVSAGLPAAEVPVFATRALSSEFSRSARIRIGEAEEACPALVLRCKDAAEYGDVLAALVESVGALLRPSKSAEAWRAVNKLLLRWSDFFREPERLTDATALGLWGELWVLTRSRQMSHSLAAWRGSEGSTYDFFANGRALEVKTSSRRGVHRMSHAQGAPLEEPGVLVSLHAIEDPAGQTLEDLQSEILSAGTDDAVYFEALSRRGVSALTLRRHRKRLSLVDKAAVYALSRVPRVTAVQPGVSDLSYLVRLDAVDELARDEAKATLELFRLRF